MTNKDLLKKQIVYRSTHRGTKEMDLLLGNFVKKHIDKFTLSELNDLNVLLLEEDGIIEKWFFGRENKNLIPKNKVSSMLKNFKL